MFLATLSIICKCGILGIGCVSIWCASGRGLLFLPKSLGWCSRLELRSHVQVRAHAHTHTGKRARSPYYHDTQTKIKVDVQ